MSNLNLSQLQGCQAQAEAALALINANEETIKYNHNIAEQLGAAVKVWQGQQQAYNTNVLDAWTNTTGPYAKFASKDYNTNFWSSNCRYRPGPGICTNTVPSSSDTNTDCQNGAISQKLPYAENSGAWIDNGGREPCGGSCYSGGPTAGWSSGQQVQCSRTQDSINSANTAWKNANPGPFPTPAPQLGVGPYVLQELNYEPITLSCCQNTIGVSPNSENKNLIQSCSQEINQSIANATSKGQTGQGTSGPSGATAPSGTFSKEETSVGTTTSGISTNTLLFGGGGFFVVCCSFIGLILIGFIIYMATRE
jgi:hypothetical protein